MTNQPGIYGLMAEFDSPAHLLEAAHKAHAEGYRKMDAYSPFPIEDLAEAIGFHRTWVAPIVLVGGILGCIGGYLMQVWISVSAYPIDVGGRPNYSWPSFIPPTFELTVLGAALAAFFGLWALNGLPHPYHPVFNARRFALASRDRFFLAIEATDPKFDRANTQTFLESLKPRGVIEIEP